MIILIYDVCVSSHGMGAIPEALPGNLSRTQFYQASIKLQSRVLCSILLPGNEVLKFTMLPKVEGRDSGLILVKAVDLVTWAYAMLY